MVIVMETHTTNISELPIDHIPQSQELPERNPTTSHALDPNVYEQRPRVAFHPQVQVRNIEPVGMFKDIHKMILLSTLFFILFNEPFVRSYIMNILVVIFGSSLKNSTGTTNKMGNIAYGLFFGLILYVTTTMIDISALNI
jgi:hypothetical protein